MFNSLAGRVIALTIIFVMIAEVLIFVPTVARFRADYMQERLERAQIASLALLATPNDMVAPALEAELLANAGVSNIVLRRDSMRELVLASPMPQPIGATYDLRDAGPFELIGDALMLLASPTQGMVRAIGEPVQGGGVAIEITLPEAPMRDALILYGLRILALSLLISVITAALLLIAVNRFIGRPIKRVIGNMMEFREDFENPERIIRPESTLREFRAAEEAMSEMQTKLISALRQKDRLAALGQAVAKISHDLRNMLTTASLLADRIERSEDPAVRRTAPKLLGSLNRAVNLCESTLAYGRVEEPQPEKRFVDAHSLVADVFEAESLSNPDCPVKFVNDVPEEAMIEADPEQLYRVLLNLVRNARQAMETRADPGHITISLPPDTAETTIRVTDTGPGLPLKAVEHLFKPFQGSQRRGGTGLGLAISAELIRNHGGRLDLVDTSPEGTIFSITLPNERRDWLKTGAIEPATTPTRTA
ncbi:sensor histidine kinase [Pontivivens insulae]|uniref:histidine kinase n=1 Tax=Pontivivens insulae TaxID=1639689 RepID=A0A2R8AE22_9RHOB|nr:HAMP domain-containing sensor histidine kinase [Pontivivens insulae]RED14417.1 signal transduction histidine kinase [Pontivivens insulae]SPF30494.1 Sensor protein kinase WalK [Pontivivens insulae]